MSSPAFMMIFNSTGDNYVIKVSNYISEKLNDYIETSQKGEVTYEISNDDAPCVCASVASACDCASHSASANKTMTKFSINNYNYSNTGLQDTYDDFYTYTPEGIIFDNIISINEQKLKAFCAYINRLTT